MSKSKQRRLAEKGWKTGDTRDFLGLSEQEEVRISEADSERVRELSQRANSGQLTAAEERELDSYLNAGRALELMKAKTRGQSTG